MNRNQNIAVIGAGPAGLTAAYELCKKGFKVQIFEASDVVGGMAKTIPLWGQLVDLGPHRFFSSDRRVNEIWLNVLGQKYSMVSRLTRIYYKNSFFDYPLKAFNALKGLGLIEAAFCILSYVKAKIIPIWDESTLETWVANRFGRRLFQIFFKSYSEKLWGISCKKLDADFAAQRIKKLSLFEAIKSSIFKSSCLKHKTLVDEFAYPHQGAGAVYNEMAKKILELGGMIHLRTAVMSVHPAPQNSSALLRLEDGREIMFDHIISSMPITTLIDRMKAPSEIRSHARKLKFRNTLLVFLLVRGNSPFPDQWIYVHSPDLKTGRITNFRNWVATINNGLSDTILCLEYWCYDEDEIWQFSDEQLINLATIEAYKTTLIPINSVMSGKVVRMPKCYPVYETGYRKHLEPIEKYLSAQEALSVVGRYGAFKYNNQDHSILMGLFAAQNIAENAGHDLWAINTDYEYQESSRITATGLTKD
jgi:protoporphyrinogen oxidase